MPQYKVESFIYYSKALANKNHIVDGSTKDMQAALDKYARDGWKLVSTDVASFGMAMYAYLYFEKP
ncbi:MAG: DUF4177 domain-containing protein [Bacteroidota bacterium]